MLRNGVKRLLKRRHVRLSRFFVCLFVPLSLLTAAGCGGNALSTTVETGAWKNGEKILPVRNIQQLPEFPSGCEITSAAIELNYLGCEITKTELSGFFPVGGRPRAEGGRMVGPDPWATFAGSPDDSGYGCFAPVVTEAVNRFLTSSGSARRAENLSGVKAADLKTYIDQGIPVIVWATISMKEPYDGDGWFLEGTDEYYRWTAREHCLVLIGYSNGQAVFSDPLDEKGTVRYDFSLFETRYRQLSSQAVVVR